MRLLVFGQTGQVARELARRCPDGVSAVFIGRDVADLADPAHCAAAIADHGRSAILNASTRPMNSQLDCLTLTHDFGIPRPDWHAGLADILKELRA